MKVFCFYILMLCVQISFAQKTFVFPKIKTQGSSIEQITPPNWTVIDQVYGDLNNDASDDLALVFEFNRSIDETRVYGDNNTDIIKETQKPRILAIFFKDKSTGNYSLSTQNNDFILRSEEGGKLGDPLQQIVIKDQQLYLRFQGGAEWRWELGYTFKFENKDWFLTSAINLYFNQNSGDMTERVYDFKTRELFTTVGNLHRRDIANRKTSEVLYFSQLRTFKTFKKPWAWEIMPNVYL
ncbi:hypothetical protein J7E50_11655 [Pedobacter sp. ISL-68]|uniref:hypothetical protein n=1 Tax=unclassified Pedobacter TaxID=2628915 RepID=UPI001BE6A8CE|nr:MULTISPECIES: hypothetical protein [unclassified Pedobacter]MBT2561490.1 hypothetical protein [Pedobacter sp. ISL-64]MBT2590879.1 hypothetical protein [Pedobacter sp. ISL-68]